ncbi:MAG: MBL fold metallo-hydrolase [Microscillaceae bacterium]|jgi:glyoxylase-like metal-dependent hydrolase (beta-lactamase superfamily II)|nr:MBL fold metallo-hydrolase [Microscillaceae bacterium]
MIQIQSFVFSPFYENTYLLFDDTHEAVVIDPGCYELPECNELKNFIQQNELKVVKLLNTHCHIDHVFGNQFIKNTYGVKLYMHAQDVPTLKGNKFASEMFGMKGFVESEPDVFVEEGETITFGDSSLEILFVPGHAPGHIAFVSKPQKFVFSGDCLFRESIGRTDFPNCNHQDLIDSITQKLFPLGDDFTVYSGHGPTTTIGHEKKFNPFLN